MKAGGGGGHQHRRGARREAQCGGGASESERERERERERAGAHLRTIRKPERFVRVVRRAGAGGRARGAGEGEAARAVVAEPIAAVLRYGGAAMRDSDAAAVVHSVAAATD